MAFNVGVNVVEVDGAGAPSITGAAVSVGAFNVVTLRGVPNQPARVTSFVQFVERFGGHFTGGLGAYLVRGFFDNGGQVAYVNRIVDPTAGTGAAPAARSLNDAANAATLTVEAGYRGQVDPGVWGRKVYLRVRHSSSAQSRLRETAPATISGTALAATVNMSALPALSVRVDGAATPTVLSFAASDFASPAAATREEIRNAINRQTNQLVCSIGGASNNQLVLTSTGEVARLTGDWTGLQVTAANATLGFSVMASPTQGTPAALSAGGTQLARPGDVSAGDAVVITDGTTTDRAKVLSVNPDTGAVTWTPNLANAAAYTNLRLVTVSMAEFDLLVASGTGDDEHVVETHAGLSMEADVANYAPRVVNHVLTGSRYIRLTDVGTPSPAADRPAVTTGYVPLLGGADGTPTANHFIGDEAAGTGFHAFNAYDIQLVCTERTDSAIVTAGLAYCAGRGDAMLVAAVPEGYVGGGQAVAYGQSLQAKKAYGALYGPWIIVPDPIGLGANPRSLRWAT